MRAHQRGGLPGQLSRTSFYQIPSPLPITNLHSFTKLWSEEIPSTPPRRPSPPPPTCPATPSRSSPARCILAIRSTSQVISVCMRYAANCGRQGQVFQTPELQPSPWGQLLVETVRLVGQSWAAEPVAGRQAFLVNLVYSLKGSTKSARVALLCKYRLPAKSFP